MFAFNRIAWGIVLCLLLAPAPEAQSVLTEPNFGSLSLNEGFTPDPQLVEVTSGGSIAVGITGCDFGYVSEAPDLNLYYSGTEGLNLYLYVIGDGDTTLLVNTPEGEWVCDDDGFGNSDPLLIIPAATSGLYNVWVGSYSNDYHGASLYISELDPTAGKDPDVEPDYSLDPTYGSARLATGFLPDPYVVDVIAGGPLELNMGECTYGFVADAPDFDLYYEADGGSDLYVYVVGDGDTTLLINRPDGNWVCNDDGYRDSHPLIRIPAASGGLYDIWVGTFDGDSTGATLYISEVDPR